MNAVLRSELIRYAGRGSDHPADTFLELARAHAGFVDEWSRDELHLERFADR